MTWSHYYEILKLDDPLEISFYAKETEIEHWSVRELKRQMKSMLFHRLALSKDKEGVLRLAQNGVETQKAEDIIRDPLVLEFAGIPARDMILEKDIEDALMRNLETSMPIPSGSKKHFNRNSFGRNAFRLIHYSILNTIFKKM